MHKEALAVKLAEPITELSCADVIISYLQHLGIKYVFGVPGGAIEPFMNALARSERNGGPQLVVARHECGAAFMADGYYRETGKMAVVCATTGPGSTNLITGVSSAVSEEVPMLVITAQTPLPKFGKRALQESSPTAIDTVGLFRYCTRYNTLVSHPEQLETMFVSAVMAAHRIPNGPSHLSIPSDILRSRTNNKTHTPSELLTHDFCVTDDSSIKQLGERLGQVDGIALYIGGSAGKARKEIKEFIEITGAGFIAGPMGKAWVDETHPHYHGVYGFAGHSSAIALLNSKKVELIIAVGASLCEISTSGWDSALLNSRLVHVDSSAEHFTRSPMANLHVLGNLKSIFLQLNEIVRTSHKQGHQWSALPRKSIAKDMNPFSQAEKSQIYPHNGKRVKPQILMSHLASHLEDEVRIFIDAGNAWAWATHYYNRSNNKGYYRIAMEFGSMGWAIGAAIGSAMAAPTSPTLCIVGDGSYLMSAQEITVAAQQHLPVVFIVLNDAALGMVKHGQRLGGQESIGWALNEINYAAMAKSMGINSIKIKTSKELLDLNINELFRINGPTLIDVCIDQKEVPPMDDRIKGLAADGPITPGG